MPCGPAPLSPAPEDDNFYYVFEPKNQCPVVSLLGEPAPTIGLIIHPGGNCDPRAYAPMAQAIASEGYLVAIIPMPNCISMGGYDRTAQVIEDFGEIEKWVLAGHSVGGTSIAWYTYEYGGIEGLVILAGLGHNLYTLDDTHNVKVLSLYGEKDTHLTPEMIMDRADFLPADTRICGDYRRPIIPSSAGLTPHPILNILMAMVPPILPTRNSRIS